MVPKVEMLYWSGLVGEMSCWPPSRSRRWRLPGPAEDTMAWSAVVILGLAGVVRSARKDVTPKGGTGAGADILHVEDEVLVTLVKDAGLGFERGLGGAETGFELKQRGGGTGGEIERVEKTEGEGEEGDKRDDADEGRRRPCREARMAVISESAARRERPSRMPTRTAMGMVTMRASGRK